MGVLPINRNSNSNFGLSELVALGSLKVTRLSSVATHHLSRRTKALYLSVSLSTNQVRTTTADVRDVFLSRSLFFIAARALCHASNGHASKDDNWRLTLSHARFLFFFLSLLSISLARLFKRCRPSLSSPPSSWPSGR